VLRSCSHLGLYLHYGFLKKEDKNFGTKLCRLGMGSSLEYRKVISPEFTMINAIEYMPIIFPTIAMMMIESFIAQF